MNKKIGITLLLIILITPILLNSSSVRSKQPESNIKKGVDIILVREDEPIDQIVVEPYSSLTNIPVITTNPDNLTKSARIQLQAHKEFGRDDVLMVGSENALSSSIEEQLISMNYNVERIGGWFRYETASRFAVEYWNPSRVDIAFVANGQDYGAASVAAQFAPTYGGGPLLLSKNNTITDYTLRALQTLEIDKAILVGSSISENAADELRNAGITPRRLGEDIPASEILQQSGEVDIYLSTYRFTMKTWDQSNKVYLGTGEDKGLASAANRIAGIDGYPILLTKNDELPKETRVALDELRANEVVIVDSNIGNEVIERLESLGYEVTTLRPDMNATTILEQKTSTGISIREVGIGAIFLVIGALSAMLYGKKRWGRTRVPFEVLTEKEQKIVNALQANNGVLKQEDLPEETNYSRPTISRILTELTKKGIIEKNKTGKTYQVELVKELEKK